MGGSLVTRLLQVQAPKVLIATVLLLLWQQNLSFSEEGRIDFFELFSGDAQATQYWSEQGFRCCKMDVRYGECMDFDHSGCFLLSLHTILNEVPDGANLLAPVCGSWSAVSRGSTWRTFVNPMGQQAFHAVSSGNRMVSRCVLLILVILARNLVFYLEQPAQSLLPRHKRVEWLMNRVSYVHFVMFWMMHFDKNSPKRSLVLSNDASISILDMGILTKAQRESADQIETTRKYVDSQGYSRYQGNALLKSTQSYTRSFAKRLLEAYRLGRSRQRYDLRAREKVDTTKSDRELFEALPCGDIWYESQCHVAFEYLYSSKHLRIPPGWDETMQSFRQTLLKEVKKIDADPEESVCI
ncbi:Uncharacterized protein SCF082_LOCUS38788 [Durusdinium trenchii]|uniref:Uncharacterized protein n=1 Tax=Durusdinium trenchii TaxID=1381693 RepID=A0ABP0Q3D3_9DINO